MSQTTLHEVAIGYLLAHQAEHLTHDRQYLIERCADHLQGHGATIERSHIVALQALGELDTRATKAHVDLTHCTSFAVFVVDPVTRARLAFTAADLIRLAREHAARIESVETRH
jgi:hypothetical protein